MAVTASNDRTVRVWDLRVDNSVQKLAEHKGPVTCLQVAMSDGGDAPLLFTGSTDGTIKVGRQAGGAGGEPTMTWTSTGCRPVVVVGAGVGPPEWRSVHCVSAGPQRRRHVPGAAADGRRQQGRVGRRGPAAGRVRRAVGSGAAVSAGPPGRYQRPASVRAEHAHHGLVGPHGPTLAQHRQQRHALTHSLTGRTPPGSSSSSSGSKWRMCNNAGAVRTWWLASLLLPAVLCTDSRDLRPPQHSSPIYSAAPV